MLNFSRNELDQLICTNTFPNGTVEVVAMCDDPKDGHNWYINREIGIRNEAARISLALLVAQAYATCHDRSSCSDATPDYSYGNKECRRCFLLEVKRDGGWWDAEYLPVLTIVRQTFKRR